MVKDALPSSSGEFIDKQRIERNYEAAGFGEAPFPKSPMRSLMTPRSMSWF